MLLPTLTTLAALLAFSSTTSASPSPSSLSARSELAPRAPPTVCNGHAELCDRSYGNVTFIGTHNSYGNGSSIMDNQGKGVVDQLVRLRCVAFGGGRALGCADELMDFWGTGRMME
jgi:hypothetical protein